MIRIGVDEAGRGVILGPLVIAGVLVSDKGLKRLNALRIQDSKNYRNAKTVVNRFMEVGSIVKKFTVRLITSQELTEKNAKEITIDQVMLPYIVEVVDELGGDYDEVRVFIDNVQYKKELTRELGDRGFEHVLISSQGEERAPVAAASIVASAQFELELRKLRLEWGDLGSGNPSDPKTLKWLKDYYSEKNEWPYFVRTYCKTIRRLENELR